MTSTWLRAFRDARVISPQNLAVAQRLASISGEDDERVVLALALSLRTLESRSVCLDLDSVATTTFVDAEETLDTADLDWPDPIEWRTAVEQSPAVSTGPEAPAARPARMVDGLLYLERYWGHEEAVRRHVDERLAHGAPAPASLDAVLDEFFTGAGLDVGEPDHQRAAARRANVAPLTIIAGGPGTGKTSTVARVLATAQEWAELEGRRAPAVGLAAPTGKAAVRLTESLRAELEQLPERFARLGTLTATTLHRLLGSRGLSAVQFTYGPSNPLPFDLVVVDEASMIPLAMMRRLLDALRPDARLVLVGDPDQLMPVEAGAVLTDIVRAPGLHDAAVELTHNWRFGSEIGALATAVRRGDADAALDLLQASTTESALRFVAVDPALATDTDLADVRDLVVRTGQQVTQAARDGAAREAVEALDTHRLLCAHRRGAYGVERWAWQAARWLAPLGTGPSGDGWSVGEPLLINRNQPDIGLYNGDSGVVIATPEGPRAAFLRGSEPLLLSAAQLSDESALYAMTVHKSQGSQFRHVTVVLPPPESPLLTRELLYTAITRARDAVTVIGTPESVRAAVERPVVRASGLRNRLGSTSVSSPG